MAVVSLLSVKGGVGKTTLTLALSDYLTSVYRKRVLLIDLDPQTDLTMACISGARWAERDRTRSTVADTFAEAVRGEPIHPTFQTVARVDGAVAAHLLVGTPRLAEIEADVMEGGEDWRQHVAAPHLVLHQALRRLAKGYDYALIDCPPSLGTLMLNGLALSDGYLVPVTPTPAAIRTIEIVERRSAQLALGLHRSIKRYGTVINRLDGALTENVGWLHDLNDNLAAKPVWRARVGEGAQTLERWDQPAPQPLQVRWGSLYEDLAALAEEFVRRIP